MKYLLSTFLFIPVLLFSYDVAIIGDSISTGLGLNQGESYSDMLKLKLPGLTINNTAVNGGSVRQIDEFIFDVFAHDTPKILILALGTADAGYRTPPALIYHKFEKVIKIALSKGTIVLIGKVRLGNRFESLSTGYKNEFHNIYLELEKNYPVTFFELINDSIFLNPRYNLDGTHPNADGNKIIEEVLEPVIKQFI